MKITTGRDRPYRRPRTSHPGSALARRRPSGEAVLMDEFTDYIASLDGSTRDAVERVRARVLELVPDAEEGMSYGMAALRYRGSPLVSARATAKHVGLYPFSPPAIEALEADLIGFSTSKGTIRFTSDRPLPDDVLDRLILFRRDEIDAMHSR